MATGSSQVPRTATAIAALVTLLLCAPWVFAFDARSTDLSALRVAHGDVPYRDFWTMYAPGSFLVMALVFRVLGEQLVWSNLLGVLTTAASVAALHRLVAPSQSRGRALLVAVVFALGFVQSGYHDGFTTYPPAILCVLLAFGRMKAFADRSTLRELVWAGFILGIGAIFKHDVAAYAALACALALLPGGPGTRLARLASLLAPAAIPVAGVIGWLCAVGAGPDLWQDLVAFPTTHFRHVRPEFFPIKPLLPDQWPGWQLDRLYQPARRLVAWAALHLPTIALVSGLVGAWRNRAQLTPGARVLVTIAAVAYPLFWTAAHVQINTHKVTMAALGLVVAGVGLARSRRLLVVLCTAWSLFLMAEPFEVLRLKLKEGVEPLRLPRLSGIWVTHREAAWMRGLHRAMAEAGPSHARVLFTGARNDVLIYAHSTPLWLTDRRLASRHHELHPGITDTEPVQQRMLADLAAGDDAVVVREHRFGDKTLDHWRAVFQSHGVPVGSRLLDEWIASRYGQGVRFDLYEVMKRKR